MVHIMDFHLSQMGLECNPCDTQGSLYIVLCQGKCYDLKDTDSFFGMIL